MKKLALACSAFALLGTSAAQAATYNVTTTWYEPQTQPRDSIFVGTFDYDITTHAVSNLQGLLSESMTDTNGMPIDADHMTWVTLGYQLESWYDATLGGTFAATFKNSTTATFYNATWKPEDGVAFGGLYSGWTMFDNGASNPGNAYALIFVPDDPLAALTQTQINKLAYADCVPTPAGGMMMGGGMMGAVCMTGTSHLGYANALNKDGTMGGYPVSQTIAAVPEPETYAMMMAGLGLVGWMSRRRKAQVAAA